jgi:hypothetical protein
MADRNTARRQVPPVCHKVAGSLALMSRFIPLQAVFC